LLLAGWKALLLLSFMFILFLCFYIVWAVSISTKPRAYVSHLNYFPVFSVATGSLNAISSKVYIWFPLPASSLGKKKFNKTAKKKRETVRGKQGRFRI